jgi:predicted kinase
MLPDLYEKFDIYLTNQAYINILIMANVQTVHLIYGPVGAGKSTYAKKLSAEKNAIHFAIDEWMHSLFGEDKPERMDMTWTMTRVQRCEAQIWLTCMQILASGRDVVLELWIDA